MYSEETRYAQGPRIGGTPARDLPVQESVGCGNAAGGGAALLPSDLGGVKLGDLPIAMAYVPPQKWCDIFEPDAALREGTQFRELALPFTGGRSGCGCKGGSRG